MITVKEVVTRQELKQFILFPFELYKNDKNWVPPLIRDEWNTFDSSKNPAFDMCEATYFLAVDDNKIVGRVAAIINHKANVRWDEKLTRFGWIAFIDDTNVSRALLDAAEAWGRAKGMKGIHGPLGFSDIDPKGLLVEGFEHEPEITTAYNFPYFEKHLVAHGFRKVADWVQYKLNIPEHISEERLRTDATTGQKYQVEALIPKTRKELKSYVIGIFNTMNIAFRDLYGFVELTDRQAGFYRKMYARFIRPEFVCVLKDESNNIIGFGFGIPSLAKAFRQSKGRLFPFGIVHVLKALRTCERVDACFFGIQTDWQHKGLPSLYFTRINQQFINQNIKFALSTGQSETEQSTVEILGNYENEPYFRTRCYQKD